MTFCVIFLCVKLCLNQRGKKNKQNEFTCNSLAQKFVKQYYFMLQAFFFYQKIRWMAFTTSWPVVEGFCFFLVSLYRLL